MSCLSKSYFKYKEKFKFSASFNFLISGNIIPYFIYIFSWVCLYTQTSSAETKALIIGISKYQDVEIPDLPFALRDAELFTSYLLANHNYNQNKENILLLSNSEATAARVATALDWLKENTQKKDTVILYFSGYAGYQFSQTFLNTPIYFYDSPVSQSTSNSFDFFKQFSDLVKANKLHFICFGILYPLVMPSVLADDNLKSKAWNIQVETFPNKFSISRLLRAIAEDQTQSLEVSQKSFNNYLLEALIGRADLDQNKNIDFKELNAFLNSTDWVENKTPGFLFVASSSRKNGLVKVDSKLSNKLIGKEDPLIASILEVGATKKEVGAIGLLTEKQQLLYHDFIVAIQLGHLMLPKERNAAMLLDSILLDEAFIPFIGSVKRRLAAALQDETQQVLNAYLNFDNREISKRRNRSSSYIIYSNYLKKAYELLGSQHFMAKMLLVKDLYFQGLQKRMDGERLNNKELFLEAISLQKQSLVYEKQAAFIYNEIGINCNLLGRKTEAIQNFTWAIDHSPSWSIPFSNLARLYLEENPEKSLRIARHAIRLSPKNSYSYNVEGMIYLKMKENIKAELSFLNAIKYDQHYPDVYYNMACVKSLQGDYEGAKYNLELAIQYGFNDIHHAMLDADLEALRSHALWNELMKKITK